MNTDTASELSSSKITEGIPIIDVAALRGGSAAQQAEVAVQLRNACEHRGFFYIRNHGVPKDLIRRVFEANQAFFDLPTDVKLTLDKSLSPCHRGYEPLRAQTLEVGAPPDLKESFYVGEEVALDDPRVLAGNFNTGPNQWPPMLPEFRQTMDAYYAQAHELGGLLVRALAMSLELPNDHFDAYLTQASATIRLLHYPPQPPNPSPGEKGCGEHTDFGGLTLLLQDEAGGLQVRDALNESWIDAPPIPDTYVVNIGDLFERWTNGRFQSTLHRVTNVSGRERYSVPFFFTGNLNHVVECLPGCAAPGEAPKYPPVTVQGHLRECYRRTYV